MKAAELRIGNLIYLGEKVIQVTMVNVFGDIDYRYFGEDETEYVRNLCDKSIEPIPLTEEWLLNFGFEKRFNSDNSNLYDFKDYSEITKKANNRGQGFFTLANFIEKHGFWLDLSSRTTIKYVHQLQNLFHALTGEELTLKS